MASPLRISVDFGKAGKHQRSAIASVLAEARREPRPDGRSWLDLRYHRPELTADNYHYTNPSWKGNYDEALAYLKTGGIERSNTVYLRTIVFQASPGFFFPKIREENWTEEMINDPRLYKSRGPIDREAANRFFAACTEYCINKFGDTFLEGHGHIDEVTGHYHAECIPIVDGRLCSKEYICSGRKQSLEFLNEIADQIGSSLGLSRAQEMTEEERRLHDGHHVSPRTLEAKIKEKEEREIEYNNIKAQRLQKEAELEQQKINNLQKAINFAKNEEKSVKIPEPFTRKLPDVEQNIFGQDKTESINAYNAARQQKIHDETQWIRDAQSSITYLKTDIQKKINHNQELKKLIQEKDNEISKLKYQINEAHLSYQRLGELSRDIRESISMQDILRDNGYIKDDKESCTASEIWRNEDGRKIGVTGQLFLDNHDPDFKGRGPIDLQMCIDHGRRDKTYFTEIIGKLSDRYGMDATASQLATHPAITKHDDHARNAALEAARASVTLAPRPEYPLPHHTPQKERQAQLWAITRGIETSTISDLIARGQMILDARGNLVIPRADGGWFARGTYLAPDGTDPAWKQTRGGADRGPAYIDGPNHTPDKPLIACESVSDALALVQRYPDARIAICGGNLRPKIKREQPKQDIYLAMDNDDAGHDHVAHYLAIYPDAFEMYPPYGAKDWADVIRLDAAERDRRLREQADFDRKRQEEEQREPEGPSLSF